MEVRQIGSLSVSVVGLGCNNFGGRIDGQAARAVVGSALDAGITFFDTADIYGGALSEEILGDSLTGCRDQVVIATKFGVPYQNHVGGASPGYIQEAVEESLRRLRTDYIDLYQLHRPDPTTPINETLAALDELVKQGKVREIGCSNFTAAQIAEAANEVVADRVGFVSVQNEYNLLKREGQSEVLAECQHRGMAFLPFYPLASGVLTGKYQVDEPPPPGTRLAGFSAEEADSLLNRDTLGRVDRLRAQSQKEGYELLDLAFGWLLSKPAVASVIAGATRPDQVMSNVAAAQKVLTSELLAWAEQLVTE